MNEHIRDLGEGYVGTSGVARWGAKVPCPPPPEIFLMVSQCCKIVNKLFSLLMVMYKENIKLILIE